MARVEIDEAELATYKGLAQAVDGMLKNPKSRPVLLQARKLSDPNAVVPEVDAAAPILGEMAKIREELAAERKARAEAEEAQKQQRLIDEAEATFVKQEQALRAAGWREDGIEAVKKHAVERGIGDLEVAAAHFEKLNPPPEPVQPNGFGSWGFFDKSSEDDTFVKSMIASQGEDEQALGTEVYAALREVRGQQGR